MMSRFSLSSGMMAPSLSAGGYGTTREGGTRIVNPCPEGKNRDSATF